MIKVTVLYGHPTDPTAFESYYGSSHLALVSKVTGFEKVELTKFLPNADGSNSDYYRMAELYYSSQEAMQQSLGSPEGKATTDDLANFATGGVKVLVGIVE